MSTTATDPASRLGAYVLPGRVDDPRPGIAQAQAGERAGLGSIWLSDRWDTKELGVMCGALSQAILRPRIVAGATHFGTRHPLVLAGLATTMHQLSGGRFELGIARSAGGVLRQFGIKVASTQALADNATILRRLWAGETFSYDGPAGHFTDLCLVDAPKDGGPPLLLAGSGPKSLAVAGSHYDGVILTPFLTPDGIRRTIEIVRNAAADAGRDPTGIKFYALVIVAPDLSPAEQEAVVGGRAVTYFQAPEVANNTIRANGWKPDVFEPMQSHPMFKGIRSVENFRREQLVEVSRLIPRELLLSGAAVGTPTECAAALQTFFDAGADEIVLHGATPDQCGTLIEEFRILHEPPAANVEPKARGGSHGSAK